ncbi:MAG: guanylate kinase [Firmicutes bacterium]|nr:guanylate kinase [Bacillota bacterium]MCL1953420.1 guanylate kinase [Bacillota bacterium]
MDKIDNNTKDGQLYIITGASGVGKGTVYNALLNKNIGLHKSISVTTRTPRAGETDGVEYFFYSIQQFEKSLSQDKFLEYAKVYGNYYGTPRDVVLQNLADQKDTILEIDLDGARQIKAKYPNSVWIFIVPPDFKTLSDRLNQRNTDSEETKKLRLGLYETELNQGKLADFVVVNDNLEHCLQSIVDIIESKRQETSLSKQK